MTVAGESRIVEGCRAHRHLIYVLCFVVKLSNIHYNKATLLRVKSDFVANMTSQDKCSQSSKPLFQRLRRREKLEPVNRNFFLPISPNVETPGCRCTLRAVGPSAVASESTISR